LEHPGEALDTPLGRLIGAKSRDRVAPTDRGDLNDVAARLLAEDGQGCPGDVDHAPEVSLDLGAEVVLREVLDGVDVGIAGVVDENVQPAEGVGRCLDRLGGLPAVGHVKSNRPGAPGVPLDEILELVRIAGCGDDILAGGQSRLGQGTPKPARASGDEPSTRHGDEVALGQHVGDGGGHTNARLP
jgi:hypothetical protein